MPLPIAGIGTFAAMSKIGTTAAGWGGTSTAVKFGAGAVTAITVEKAIEKGSSYVICKINQYRKTQPSPSNVQLEDLEAEAIAPTLSEASETGVASTSQTVDKSVEKGTQVAHNASGNEEKTVASGAASDTVAGSKTLTTNQINKGGINQGSASEKDFNVRVEVLEEALVEAQAAIGNLETTFRNELQDSLRTMHNELLQELRESISSAIQQDRSSRSSSRSSRSHRDNRSDTTSLRADSRPISPMDSIDTVPMSPTVRSPELNSLPPQHPSFYFGPSVMNQNDAIPTLEAGSEYGYQSVEEGSGMHVSAYTVLDSDSSSYVAASVRSVAHTHVNAIA